MNGGRNQSEKHDWLKTESDGKMAANHKGSQWRERWICVVGWTDNWFNLNETNINVWIEIRKELLKSSGFISQNLEKELKEKGIFPPKYCMLRLMSIKMHHVLLQPCLPQIVWCVFLSHRGAGARGEMRSSSKRLHKVPEIIKETDVMCYIWQQLMFSVFRAVCEWIKTSALWHP